MNHLGDDGEDPAVAGGDVSGGYFVKIGKMRFGVYTLIFYSDATESVTTE